MRNSVESRQPPRGLSLTLLAEYFVTHHSLGMGNSIFLLTQPLVIANEELLYEGMKLGIISCGC
jgi:hypothetical protein